MRAAIADVASARFDLSPSAANITAMTPRRLRPLILLTNDDGIDAPGLKDLYLALRNLGRVRVVAPAQDQSAASHSFSLRKPLRVFRRKPCWLAVRGTPTDCLLVSHHGILKRRIDLVFSGINDSPNLGDDVLYSGTVAAAIEGAMLGMPAVAVINLLMAGLFWLVAKLPPDAQVGPQLEFGAVLAPVWRIVIASIVAEVAAELVDTEVYQLWVNRFKQRLQWMRVLASNSVSVPLDSALFCGLAFVGRMPVAVVFSIFLANILAKGIVTVVSLPWIYLVRERPAAG